MDLILKHGNLNELRIKLRVKYPQLTETDLQYKEGAEENMLRMVEYKLHVTKAELQKIIKRF